MDARHNATATTTQREILMADLLSGKELTAEQLGRFPCTAEELRSLQKRFKEKFPTATQTKRIGGMGKHHDLCTTRSAIAFVREELKVKSENGSSHETLLWRPWIDTVQFLQGQIKSKIGQSFLGDCGTPMLQEWFNIVKIISAGVPEAAAMTSAGYEKAMSTIGMKGTQEAAAKAFINALRGSDDLKALIKGEWLRFEERWFQAHTLNHNALLGLIKEIIEEKDMWICVSKNACHLIEGLKVDNLAYIGERNKPKGGKSFHYTLTLRRGEETKEVPLECKFHWKNGGQGVQNLNFMLL